MSFLLMLVAARPRKKTPEHLKDCWALSATAGTHFPWAESNCPMVTSGAEVGGDEKSQTNRYSFKSAFSQKYVKLKIASKNYQADHL